MKKVFFIALIIFISSFELFSQQINVKGKVTDELNKLIPGVSILIKESNRGTITDLQGHFSLNASVGDLLVFSCVGFETKEMIISGEVLNIQLKSGVSLNEVVVLGSRKAGRTVIDSPVPIDVIDIKQMSGVLPQVNVNQILNFSAPSFSANNQNISDGTDHVDPASLRGMGTDQVLVLINGKRRHNSALINVNGTFGRGSAGTDLNAIPVAAIDRIEVLRDGAAAQYGSDAIAGVINIILKKSINELSFVLSSGANFSKYANDRTGGMDGEVINFSANYGLPLGKNGGSINFTGDFDYRQGFGRMKEFEGAIFNAYNAIEKMANADGFDISLLQEDMDAIKNYAAAVNYFSSNLQTSIADASSIADLQNILNVDVTDQELLARNFNRSDFNMRMGQSAMRGGRFFANLSLPLDYNGTELYSFAGISSRMGNAAGFYRLPNQNRTYTPIYINGFLPEINTLIQDQSLVFGIKGKISDWTVDFSNTYGKNSFMFEVANSSNASMLNASPTTFNAGGFSFMQNTTNLDVSRYYTNIFEDLNLAFGAEYRLENFAIVAGENASYVQYDDIGQIITFATQQPSVDFFGQPRPGGSQVYPGFSPENELSKYRNSIAAYFDMEVDFTSSFLASFATRYENYSDFGSTFNFKLALRYKLNQNVNIRAAVNTGFRAPSLHQLYFNKTNTIFDQDGVPQEVGTFSNDSRVASLLGIPALKEETSKSVSLGFTAKDPKIHLAFTLDVYFIRVDDRIVYTGQFQGPGNGTEMDNILSQANASRASFFANAIDTETKGLDWVLTHNYYFGSNMKLRSELSGSFTKTRRVGEIKASEVIENAGLVDVYFPEDSRIYLEEATPSTKLKLSFVFTANKWNVFLRNAYFGKVTEATINVNRQEVFSPKVVTDLSFGYQLSSAMQFTVGVNNLLDVYPDQNSLVLDDGGNNRSLGRFDWSRRAQQFGIGGRYIFLRLSLNIK